MPEVTVIVPARNAAATLPALFEGLLEQWPDELIVVDDGSSDETAVLARAAGARVVEGPRSGPGSARNAGAAAATHDALVFLDADCVPVSGWLQAGLRELATTELVQGRVLPDPDAPRGPWDRSLSVGGAYGLFESANLFVRRELFERLGGFEDWLPGPEVSLLGASVGEKGLGEDVDFGWRARRAGASTGFAQDALVYHAVFAREALEFAAERKRLRAFPHMARRIPELRDEFFVARLFLPHRPAFDAAAAGVLLALATRRPAALVAAVPYALALRRRVRHWPDENAAEIAAVNVLADAVGLVALVRGSLEARSPVL